MTKSAPKKNELLTLRVNLLHPQGEPLKLPTRFLRWLLGYGRFIVILVEIVVITCFLYRFKLDADLQRINQEIKLQTQDLDSKKNDEVLVRQTQQKIQLIKQTYDGTPNWQNLLSNITSKVPAGVTFLNLSIDHSQNSSSVQFKINAQTKNPIDVTAFINGLKQFDQPDVNRQFKDITLANIAFDSGVISFAITGTTK